MPDYGYVAPAPEERRGNHLTNNRSVVESLLVRTGVDFGGDSTAAGDADGTSYIDEYKDRSRTECTLYGANQENDLLYRYGRRLKEAAGTHLRHLGMYPEDPAIMRMSQTVPQISILPNNPTEDRFDNYIAVVLAVMSLNSNLPDMKSIVESVVNLTESSTRAQSARVTKQRTGRISEALSRFLNENSAPVSSIHTLDSASIAQRSTEQRKRTCWTRFRTSELFTTVCSHFQKRANLKDLSVPDPFSDGAASVSLQAEVFRQMDRILIELERRKSGHRDDNLFDMVHQSVWNRLGLTQKIGPTGLRLLPSSSSLVWKPPS